MMKMQKEEMFQEKYHHECDVKFNKYSISILLLSKIVLLNKRTVGLFDLAFDVAVAFYSNPIFCNLSVKQQ